MLCVDGASNDLDTVIIDVVIPQYVIFLKGR